MSEAPDGTAIAAIITAATTGLATVVAVFKGRTDGKNLQDRVDGIEGTDGKGGALAALASRIEAVSSRCDPKLRADLDSLAEIVRRHQRTSKPVTSVPAVTATGSFPAISTEILRLDDLERRIKATEDRSAKNESRIDKLDETLDTARLVVTRIETHLEHILQRGSR